MSNSKITNINIPITPYAYDLSGVSDYLDKIDFQLLTQIAPYKNHNIWTAVSLHGFGPNASDIYKPGFTDSKVKIDNNLQWTSLFNNPLMKPINEIILKLPCEFERIRITKLVAGKTLKKHTDNIDNDIRSKKIARVHIPIRTNSKVIFTLYEDADDEKGQAFKLKTGHYYCLDVTKPHSVSNNSNTDRYHLVVDCFLNNKLKTLLKGFF